MYSKHYDSWTVCKSKWQNINQPATGLYLHPGASWGETLQSEPSAWNTADVSGGHTTAGGPGTVADRGSLRCAPPATVGWSGVTYWRWKKLIGQLERKKGRQVNCEWLHWPTEIDGVIQGDRGLVSVEKQTQRAISHEWHVSDYHCTNKMKTWWWQKACCRSSNSTIHPVVQSLICTIVSLPWVSQVEDR